MSFVVEAFLLAHIPASGKFDMGLFEDLANSEFPLTFGEFVSFMDRRGVKINEGDLTLEQHYAMLTEIYPVLVLLDD